MRRMITRQAIKLLTTLMLLTGMIACSPSQQTNSIFTPVPPTEPQSVPETPTFLPVPTATVTPLVCLIQPGRVEAGSLDSTKPPQEFRIYLPPCYDERTDRRYPVLYLLHGQTFTDDQWIRLGAVTAADDMILSGESVPFIIVFPDDRYWNLQAGPLFGQRLVNDLIPYIDAAYRTFPDRDQRAIGGMSRGANWSLRLGLSHWELFGSIGLHSLAATDKDAAKITVWLADIPASSRPRIFMDIGDNDPELEMAQKVEARFNDLGLSHEWHLYTGAHTEEYWRTHVQEYLQWYADGWNNP